MKNKKHIILLLALFITSIVQAQEAVTVPVTGTQAPISPEALPQNTGNLPVIATDPEAESIGLPRVADEKLTTVLIDDFEVPQGWLSSIPLDFGLSKILYRDGAPQDIATDVNKTVLGVKTVFFRRNFGWMSIDKPYPLSLKNIVRSFSVWIAGRNRRHVFFVKVRDMSYNKMRLSGGEMRFQGWKKVLVPVTESVDQFNPTRNNNGLDLLGFHIAFNAEDINILEPYYIYFDQFTASLNMSATQKSDDIRDDW